MNRTLLSILKSQDKSRLALISPHATYRLCDLLEQAESRHADARASSQCTAELSSETLEGFIVDLIAYDGLLKAFLLQPKGDRQQADWLERSGSTYSCPLLPEESTTWLIPTSGTTGTPKAIEHSFRSLTASTKCDLQIGQSHRWGLLYDPARFAGLQVLLQALVSGSALVAPSPDANIDNAIDFMALHSITSLSATPSYWRKILMSPSGCKLKLLQITLGGEIADQAILSALSKAYPDVKITHIYASTEAGVGFSVKDGKAGFPTAYLSENALPGITLKIDSQNHLLIRKHDIIKQYDTSYLDTDDLVEIKGDRVYFLGRANGAINIGGNKVLPEKIESLLLQHPDVIAARIFAKRNPIMGNLVMAEVQLASKTNQDATLKELRSICQEQLQRWERPVSIQITDQIKISQSGKISRV